MTVCDRVCVSIPPHPSLSHMQTLSLSLSQPDSAQSRMSKRHAHTHVLSPYLLPSCPSSLWSSSSFSQLCPSSSSSSSYSICFSICLLFPVAFSCYVSGLSLPRFLIPLCCSFLSVLSSSPCCNSHVSCTHPSQVECREDSAPTRPSILTEPGPQLRHLPRERLTWARRLRDFGCKSKLQPSSCGGELPSRFIFTPLVPPLRISRNRTHSPSLPACASLPVSLPPYVCVSLSYPDGAAVVSPRGVEEMRPPLNLVCSAMTKGAPEVRMGWLLSAEMARARLRLR